MNMLLLTIRDAATEIRVLAGRLHAVTDPGEVVLWRAGYGETPADHHGYVLVVHPEGCEAHTDPYRWGDATRRAAHLALRDLNLIDDLIDGDELDVEPYRLQLIEGQQLRRQVEAPVTPGAHDHDVPPDEVCPPCALCGDDGAGTSRFDRTVVLCPDHLIAEAETVNDGTDR